MYLIIIILLYFMLPYLLWIKIHIFVVRFVDMLTRSIWKCWAHSPLRAAARRLFYIAMHQVSLLLHAACASMSSTTSTTVVVDVVVDIDNDDNNDNAWQRGPLWPHGMGPMIAVTHYVVPLILLSCNWSSPAIASNLVALFEQQSS